MPRKKLKAAAFYALKNRNEFRSNRNGPSKPRRAAPLFLGRVRITEVKRPNCEFTRPNF